MIIKRVANIFLHLTMLSMAMLFVLPFVADAQGFTQIAPPNIMPDNAIDARNADTYFSSLFNIFITVVAVVAVIKLMICGLQYMTSESIPGKGAAKTCITYIFYGLMILLTSFILLEIVNRSLVGTSFNSITTAISEGIGDVSNLNEDVALDAPKDPPQPIARNPNDGDWYYSYRAAGQPLCANPANPSTQSFDGAGLFTVARLDCLSDQSSTRSQPAYTVINPCRDTGTGTYTAVLGNWCSGATISVSGSTVGECGRRVALETTFGAYLITQECRRCDPPAGSTTCN